MQAILMFDCNKLKAYINDEALINIPIHENGLSLLHLLSNLNLIFIATRTAKPLNVIEDQARELVELSLSKGYNADIPDHHGRSPLHYAASQGNNSLIKLLIQFSNGDNNPLTMGGETPLMKSIYFSKNSSAKLLLSYCKNFTIKNSCGKNALDIAKSSRNEEMSRILEVLTARLRSRVLWIFIRDFEYCRTAVPYQSGLEYKQKEKILEYL